ncbi:hypothetical protein EGW08_001259, partial [Elysia chlorotica]
MLCPRHHIKRLARTAVSGTASAPPITAGGGPDSGVPLAPLDVNVSEADPPKPFKDIPGPSWMYQWPIIGTALLFNPFSRFKPQNIQSLFQYMFERYGPIVRLQLGGPTVLIYEPKDFEQLFA